MSSRQPLDGERFDVIVIGGGINGVAIARECARGGRRTLLVEQHDFASGTTCRSTRIIHGGLRYLEHSDIAQVRESLRERQRLARAYPNLVTPMEFLLALDRSGRRSALAVRVGLWLYKQFGGSFGEISNNGNAAAQLERLLDAGREFSIFSFEDAQCEFPERLVAQWLIEALAAGCVARNHTQVLTVKLSNGRAVGARLRDRITNSEESVNSTWVINSSGPWADQICQLANIQTKHPMIGGVRGSHVVLPPFPGMPDAAVYAEAADGRPFFVIPWNGQILVGSTEVADRGDPGQAQPSGDEIQYLLTSLRRLFPNVSTGLNDMRYAFAGVRPLPYSPDSNPSAITRRHHLHDHADDGAAGMISVIGGKLTTAASLARECAEKIGVAPKRPAVLPVVAQDRIDDLLERRVSEIAAKGKISHESAQGLAEWFSDRAAAIAQMAAENESLRAPLCPGTEHIVSEAVYAFEHEAAVTLADVLLRRVPVALSGNWSEESGREGANRIGNAIGWDERRVAQELEGFEEERCAFLKKPTALLPR